MQSLTRLYLIVAILCSSVKLQATHIVGGDLTYTYLGGNDYKVHLYLYVDCQNGSLNAIFSDRFSKIGVFTSSGFLYTSLSLNPDDSSFVKGTNYGCVIPPTDECVKLFIYSATANLPDRPGGYYLEFQRCCRNNSIKNIVSPGSTGSTYRTSIPERAMYGANSSPRFVGVPPNFLCAGEILSYDHSAQDDDGDSLVYEFINPLHGASSGDPSPDPSQFTNPISVLWANGFNTSNQISSNPTMQLNPNTGLFVITPTAIGQYVVGIAVHEYRNHVRINTVFRDFQFNVYNCQFSAKSIFAPVNGPCSDTVKFSNASTATTGKIDSYKWDFGIDSLDGDTSVAVNPTFVFPGPGEYKIKLTAYSNAGCGNSSFRTINILPSVIDDLVKDSIVCYGDSIELSHINSEPGISYNWSPSDGLDDPTKANPYATVTKDMVYTVRKSSISCYVDNEVQVFKNTINADFRHEYLPPCDGLRVKFFGTGTNYDQQHWDFGDMNSDRDFSLLKDATWFYSDSGIVYVRYDVSNEYCKDSIIKPLHIIFPEIFTAEIDTFICLGDQIVIGPLNDTSILSFQWSNVDYMSTDTALYPKIQPTKTVSYVLTKTYATCQTKDSFNVIVNELPDFSIARSYPEKVCVGDSILLSAEGNYTFEWFPKNGVRTPDSSRTWVIPDTARWYYLEALTQAKCAVWDSVYLEQYPVWELNLDPFYIKCQGEVFLPQVDIKDAELKWIFKSSDALTDSLRQEGTYVLNVLTRCQNLLDTFDYIYYQDQNCRFEMPNAFSPNGDGVNDTYPYDGRYHSLFGRECDFDSYHLIIFNRWGEVVFRSDVPGEEWDGQYKSDGGIEEVFGYYLSYREWDFCRGGWVVKSKRGNITVLH
ncbi:MAG: hypothetical protein GC180_01500 [Bacteroidetes bacterium]|nr:hypothetical protein [Bacteroidota bacterium]